MIYVDELRDYPNGQWCHMWSDVGTQELISFAQKIGLNKNWIQHSTGIHGVFIHFDLRPPKRQIALENGAKFLSLKDYIRGIVKEVE